MMANCQIDLRQELAIGCPNAGSALNPYFSSMVGLIEKYCVNRHTLPDAKYNEEENSALLRMCRQHERDHAKIIYADNIIALVHPIYLQVSHQKRLQSDIAKETAAEYHKRLMEFLYRNPKRDKVGILVLDTIHHYAAATSLLLEQGLVDKVVFTQEDRGLPLADEDLDEYRNKIFFVGGGYDEGACLTHGVETLHKLVGEQNVYGISDLSLKSPNCNQTLTPTGVEKVAGKRVYTIAEVAIILNLSGNTPGLRKPFVPKNTVPQHKSIWSLFKRKFTLS